MNKLLIVNRLGSEKVADTLRMHAASAQRDRAGAVSLIFAIASIPILMLAGLAIDYGFYNEARAQLNMAADAASIHAVHVASQAFQSNQSDYLGQGNTAGTQWFRAQLGVIGQGISATPVVSTQYDASSRTFTAQVTYGSRMSTFFGGVFGLSKLATWPIGVTSTATITVPGYVEVQMMLDNSSSMLIASSNADILAMEKATPCSTQAANEGQTMNSAITYSNGSYSGSNTYTYNYPLSTQMAPNSVPAGILIPYGYNQFTYPAKSQAGTGNQTINQVSPPNTPPPGSVCDSRFTGNAGQCFYPPAKIAAITQPSGTCKVNGVPSGGGSGYLSNPNTPQAPCAFACHNMPGTGAAAPDYYGLARTIGVRLRFDDVHEAASAVVTAMQQFQQSLVSQPQLSVGVSVFNAKNTNSAGVTTPAFTNLYPGDGKTEAGTDLARALASTTLQPLQVNDSADTDVPAAMAGMTALLTKAGDGGTPATPQKNLFIVTDGLQDYDTVFGSGNSRVQGAIDPAICDPIKALNVKIFVLYTKYLPLPNEYYLDNDQAAVEGNGIGTPPVAAALRACASGPAYYFEATNGADIQRAMQNMLAIALNVPGRLTQ